MNKNESQPLAVWRSILVCPEEEPIVRIEQLTKTFGNTYAVDGISLNIHRGEFFSLLGASGCGKSTLLRMLGGFETPTSGRIFIDGQDITNVPPYLRPINMMFQSYALFPHMNVAQNIAYGLKQERMPSAQIRERVSEMMALVQIDKLARASRPAFRRPASARCPSARPSQIPQNFIAGRATGCAG